MRILFFLALLVFASSSANIASAQAEPATSIDRQTELRLTEIELDAQLKLANKQARIWHWSWVGFLSGAFVAQGILTGVANEGVEDRLAQSPIRSSSRGRTFTTACYAHRGLVSSRRQETHRTPNRRRSREAYCSETKAHPPLCRIGEETTATGLHTQVLYFCIPRSLAPYSSCSTSLWMRRFRWRWGS